MAELWGNEELDPARPAIGYAISLRGKLAITLVERWGTVAGYDTGEDSAGRAKIGLMLPADVVNRATEMASLLVDALEQREWVKPGTALPEEVAERAGRIEQAKYELRLGARKAEPAPTS